MLVVFFTLVVVFRKRASEALFLNYGPIVSKMINKTLFVNSVSAAIFALYAVCFGLVLLHFYLMKVGKPIQITIGNTSVALMLLLSGALFVIWSIPGYYRWKKSGMTFELIFFLCKLVIGVLCVFGISIGLFLGWF